MMNTSQIAQAIRSQLSTMELLALGAKNLRILPETQEHLGGLKFEASLFGKKFCHVFIELDFSDTYNVSVKDRKYKVISSQNDVYCDELQSVVTSMVEAHFRGEKGER